MGVHRGSAGPSGCVAATPSQLEFDGSGGQSVGLSHLNPPLVRRRAGAQASVAGGGEVGRGVYIGSWRAPRRAFAPETFLGPLAARDAAELGLTRLALCRKEGGRTRQ